MCVRARSENFGQSVTNHPIRDEVGVRSIFDNHYLFVSLRAIKLVLFYFWEWRDLIISILEILIFRAIWVLLVSNLILVLFWLTINYALLTVYVPPSL